MPGPTFFCVQANVREFKFLNANDAPCGSAGKESTAMRETWVWSLGWEDPLEKGKATHSSILAWRIPWMVHGVAKSRT